MKKPQYYYIGAGIVVLLSALVFVLAQSPSIPSDDTSATSTATTTTDIFDMEPIIPEAKVSTEGWKTCRNEEYGWEVKYPGEWYVWDATSLIPCTTTNHFQIVSDQPKNASHNLYNNESSYKIRVYNSDTLASMGYTKIASVDDYYNRQLGFKPGPPAITATSTLGNTKVLWMGFDEFRNLYGAVMFYHNSSIYHINFSNIDTSLAQTILSTFRFLDISSTTATSPSV